MLTRQISRGDVKNVILMLQTLPWVKRKKKVILRVKNRSRKQKTIAKLRKIKEEDLRRKKRKMKRVILWMWT